MPTNVFDNTFPPDTQQANQLGQDIRTFKLDMQQRMGAISDTLANRWNPATDVQPTQWTGLLFFATDTGQVFRWNGAAWVDVTANLSGSVLKYSDLVVHNIVGDNASHTGSSITIPANTLQVGSQVTVVARAILTGFTSGTPQFGLNIGTQVGALSFVVGSPVNVCRLEASFAVVSASVEVGVAVPMLQNGAPAIPVRQYNGTDPISGAITISTGTIGGPPATFTATFDFLQVVVNK